MDGYPHRDRSEERAEGPIFRGDVEGRPEEGLTQRWSLRRYHDGRSSDSPYETTVAGATRPESGFWPVLKRLFAPLAALGLLLMKFKGLLLLLLKAKFLGTALTMFVSVGAYALLFPVWFAVGFVALIWVHEMGHVLQLKREGIEASAPMFVPFFGAFVAMKEMPKNALAEARVGLAGPVLGTLGSLGALGIYAVTQNPLFLGLSYVGFFLNLFNLAPMLPLDGGRAVGAMSPFFWLFGIALTVALLFVAPNPVLIIVALLGGMELWRRWKRRNTPEGKTYHEVETRHRVIVGLVYFGLVAILALLMAATYVPDAAALRG